MDEVKENEKEKEFRKSHYRRYYMISQSSLPIMVYLGTTYPSALKVLLYLLNKMDKENKLDDTDYKTIQAAYKFQGKKVISTEVISKMVRLMSQMQITDLDYADYNTDCEAPISQIKEVRRTFHTIVVNPQLSWSTYMGRIKNCKFTAHDQYYRYLLKHTQPKRKWDATGVKRKKVLPRNLGPKTYYTINKNYENDFYWLAHNNMASVTIFFYLMGKMNLFNEVNIKQMKEIDKGNYINGGTVQEIAEYLKMNRQSATEAIQILKRYNFIYVQKEGQRNTYILNPEVVWASEKENREKCKFPANLAVNTPWKIDRLVSDQKEKESSQKKLYTHQAERVWQYFKDSSYTIMQNKSQMELIKMKRKITEEFGLLENSCNNSVILELFEMILDGDTVDEQRDENL